MIKLCFTASPIYIITVILDQIRNEVSIFFEHTIGIGYVLEAAEFHYPFRKVAAFILILAACITLGMVFTVISQHLWAAKGLPKVRRKVKMALYEKAKEQDLECYDNPEYYNELVLAISEADKQIDRCITFLQNTASGISMFISACIYFIMKDKTSILFAMVSFLMAFFFNQMFNKLTYIVRIKKNPLERKREYVKRVFYLNDYAKEIRLNPEVSDILCISLILIIKNAFLVSMQSRLHQLGILQSIGATPRQIRLCLLQEALGLCLIPIMVGIGGGVALCVGIIVFANGIVGIYSEENAVFTYNIALFLISLITSLFTVLYSAWLPARRLSKMSPLQVIRGEEEKKKLRKVKKFRLISLLFGMEGELARKSLYVRRKSLRTANLSLTLSFLAFSIFLCTMALSGISTKYTYFDRYKDAWDIMVTVKDQNRNDIEEILNMETLNQVDSCYVYQKALVYTGLTDSMFSNELKEMGGILEEAGSNLALKDGGYHVKVPIVILDDKSFQNYCESIGVKVSDTERGMVTINRIWDSVHSTFRNREYLPFI